MLGAWAAALLLTLLGMGCAKPVARVVVACWKRRGRTFEDWFRTALLQSCEMDYLCFHELEDADQRGDVAFVHRYLAPGSFFVGVVDPREPFCCGIASALLAMCAKYNVSSHSLYFGHTGDESRPPFPKIEEFYRRFRKVYRNFWWDVEPFVSLRREGALDWFPLGPLAKNASAWSMVPSSKREQLVYFSGGRHTNSRRPRQVQHISQLLNLTVSGGFKAASNYMQDLRSSVFCLNIRGTSAECFRFYESIEAGCIPLMLDRYPDFDYGDQHRHQYAPLLEARPGARYPFLWAADGQALLADFDALARSGADGLAKLDALQSEMLEWYGAVKTHLDRRMSADLCPSHRS